VSRSFAAIQEPRPPHECSEATRSGRVASTRSSAGHAWPAEILCGPRVASRDVLLATRGTSEATRFWGFIFECLIWTVRCF